MVKFFLAKISTSNLLPHQHLGSTGLRCSWILKLIIFNKQSVIPVWKLLRFSVEMELQAFFRLKWVFLIILDWWAFWFYFISPHTSYLTFINKWQLCECWIIPFVGSEQLRKWILRLRYWFIEEIHWKYV